MNLSKFLADTLISGHANGSFTTEQVIIFVTNYQMRGQVSQEDYQRVMNTLFPPDNEEEIKYSMQTAR